MVQRPITKEASKVDLTIENQKQGKEENAKIVILAINIKIDHKP